MRALIGDFITHSVPDRFALPRGISLKVARRSWPQCIAALRAVDCDDHSQDIAHLVSNAIKYTDHGDLVGNRRGTIANASKSGIRAAIFPPNISGRYSGSSCSSKSPGSRRT